MTGADRIAKTAAEDQANAERKRALDLVTWLADDVLEARQSLVGHADVQWFLGRMAQELVTLAAVLRDGGDSIELERRLVALGNRKRAGG